MKNEIFDKVFDELLNEAVPQYMETVNYDEKADVKFSKEHEEKMQALFKEVKKREKLLTLSKISKRVAIIIVGVVVVMMMLVPNISAWKEKILKFFTKDETEYSWLLYSDPSDAYKLNFGSGDADKGYKITFLGYVPEGYMLEVLEDSNKVKYLSFINSDKKINLKIFKNTNVTVDSESAGDEVIIINERNINVFIKNNNNSFIWNDEFYTYRLYGNLEKDEFVKVIENINYEEIKNIF